ncbi:unnamed protein product [Linum tenue]|uniref:Uncharacterized protein n=1 Tax=Linum tenue TaxID=586396 RepID=A0AAV0H6K5_9ROSI|nr:unnamed protein product [Linum tenue]CAI0382682.1 unnamed protein product [Linum tenue]CAI0393602.1 unnamed protein product [Linum tenue]CAI0400708.1 unnamed protein product [Linum tenue]CAI0401501.1 unnamed protein product [Linum tenue]
MATQIYPAPCILAPFAFLTLLRDTILHVVCASLDTDRLSPLL